MHLIILTVLLIASWSAANEVITENASEKADIVNSSILEKKPQLPIFQSVYLPNDFSLKSGIGQILLIGGAAVLSFILIGGAVIFLAPVLGYKVCNFFGNCEPTVTAYSAGGNLQAIAQNSPYDMYGSYVPSTGFAAYQKRSLDYVGPILKTLASAYDKYEQKKRN